MSLWRLKDPAAGNNLLEVSGDRHGYRYITFPNGANPDPSWHRFAGEVTPSRLNDWGWTEYEPGQMLTEGL